MNPQDAPTVFVVDDDADVRASIQGLLKSARLGCASFGTAEEFLRNKPPDGPSCLVLDVSLPGVNGLELQRETADSGKAHVQDKDVSLPGVNGLELQRELADAGVRIPIIFITGHGDIPMTVKAMKSGAVEFLTKPFHDQDLR